jgi:3-deoxy-D-manno-octulosonic-acid transferase
LASIDPLRTIVTSYLASPQGQEMIRDYLSSPEGQQAICEFAGTQKGREALKNVLPSILSCLYMPVDLQSAVSEKLKEIP